MRVSENWASALRDAFNEHPEAAFISGQTGLPEGQEDSVRPVALMTGPESTELRRGLSERPGHSANLAVRNEALQSIKGFDEVLGAGAKLRAAEDSDLFDRLFSMGYTGRYEKAVLAWHEQWRSRPELVKLDFAYGVGCGARVAKLLRTNRVHGLKAGKEIAWYWGIREFRKGPFLAITAVARMFGAFIGFLRAIRLPVLEGHFVQRPAA